VPLDNLTFKKIMIPVLIFKKNNRICGASLGYQVQMTNVTIVTYADFLVIIPGAFYLFRIDFNKMVDFPHLN
jgi:hypothetical protein